MKLLFSDTEAIQLLSILKERKFKYMGLAALASARSGKNKFSKNATKLQEKHKAKAEMASGLMMKISEQL